MEERAQNARFLVLEESTFHFSGSPKAFIWENETCKSLFFFLLDWVSEFHKIKICMCTCTSKNIHLQAWVKYTASAKTKLRSFVVLISTFHTNKLGKAEIFGLAVQGWICFANVFFYQLHLQTRSAWISHVSQHFSKRVQGGRVWTSCLKAQFEST